MQGRVIFMDYITVQTLQSITDSVADNRRPQIICRDERRRKYVGREMSLIIFDEAQLGVVRDTHSDVEVFVL